MTKRKRLWRLAAGLGILVILLSGCMAPWSTVQLEEILPSILDEYTGLVQVESITVTRIADGASAVVSGTEVEVLYDCFTHTACTRRSGTVSPLYTLQFTMTAPSAGAADATIGEYRGSVCIAVGEYRYRPVTVSFDLTYIEALFAE